MPGPSSESSRRTPQRRSGRQQRRPRPARVAEIERETGHDLAAFVDAVGEGLDDEGAALAPLRADVVRRPRHGARAPDSRGGRARARRRCPRVRARRRAGGGAPRHADHRPNARRPRRADDVRPEARRLGVRARPQPQRGSSEPSTSMRVGKLSGAVGTYAATTPSSSGSPASASVSSRRRTRRRSSSATATPSCSGALAVVASSLDEFALEIRHLARTEVREVEEPFARGQKGSSAMPHKRNPITAERICGLARVVRAAAQVGARERRALARARHLALLRRARRPPRRVPRARLHARPLHVARRRPRRPPRAHAAEPRVEPRALLQPARAARARRVRAAARRGVPARPAPRDGGVGRRARLPRARRAPIPRSPAASTSTPSSTSAPTRATSTSSSTASTRLRKETVHV